MYECNDESEDLEAQFLFALSLQMEELDIASQALTPVSNVLVDDFKETKMIEIHKGRDFRVSIEMVQQEMQQLQSSKSLVKALNNCDYVPSTLLKQYLEIDRLEEADHLAAHRLANERNNRRGGRYDHTRSTPTTARVRAVTIKENISNTTSALVLATIQDEHKRAHTRERERARVESSRAQRSIASSSDYIDRSSQDDNGTTNEEIDVYENSQQTNCLICCEIAPVDSENLPCGHLYCYNCLRNLCLAALRDRSLVPIHCCHIPVFENTINTMYTDEERKKYAHYLTSVKFPGYDDDSNSPSELEMDAMLTKLVRKKNWKICPHCKTPVEKKHG
eukprot:Awhi_evm1s3375